MPAGTITALQVQEKDKERINVFIDGDFAIGISLRTLQSSGLHRGKTVDDQEWQGLIEAEQLDKAYNSALHYLAARPRSLREIRDRLRRKDYPTDHIEAAMTRLERIGLADDTAFTRFWVENRQNSRPRSARALRSELMQKGVAREIIEVVLLAQVDPNDDHANARELARSAVRKYAREPDKQSFTRKLGAFLGRRGYGFDVIRPIIDELWDELQSSSEDR